MHARIFESGVFGLMLLAIILAVVVGVWVSIWLGLVLLVVLALGSVSLVYNFDYWLVRRLLDADDRLMFDLCESGFVGTIRRLAGKLPADPRCRFCLMPFSGVGSLLRIPRSAKNPNYCRSCFEALPEKTHDTEAGVLFADIRGYTQWTEKHSSEDVVDALTRFYALANRVLTTDDALVEFVGDQVMAIYATPMPSLRNRTPEVMVAAARRLVATIRETDDALPVGIGLNLGVCQVGAVAKGDAKDFTAVGDVVNTAARLQSSAGQDEIVLSEAVYERVQGQVPEARSIMLELKGKAEPLRAYVIPPLA